MSVIKLAEIFEYKYLLKFGAGNVPDIINNIKKDLINAYNLYVNSDKAKDPILQILADAGEPFSKSFINGMNQTVANIDVLGQKPELLFKQLNKLLGAISLVKTDPEKTVRNFINDNVRVTKESERNYREHLKSKFEMILYRLSSILSKQVRVLKSILMIDVETVDKAFTPERKNLSKDKLFKFMDLPVSKTYGLDNIDVFSYALSFPELRERITTLINALDRGHTPVDGPEVKEEVKSIRDWLKSKDKTNLSDLENAPENPAPKVSLFDE